VTLFGRPRRAPLVIAVVLAAPLFFAALMASSLAVEKPHVDAQWLNHAYWAHKGGKLHGRVFLDQVLSSPSTSNEILIWLCALIPPAILVAIGAGAAFLRRGGVYLSCAAGAALALLLRLPLGTWARHHTARFPFGVDNIPDGSSSNQLDRGEWEHLARETVISIGNVTILFAAVIAALYAIGHWRRARALTHALSVEAETRAAALEDQRIHS
jgi:hypothetical protein